MRLLEFRWESRRRRFLGRRWELWGRFWSRFERWRFGTGSRFRIGLGQGKEVDSASWGSGALRTG